jgi:hypothetical protein
VSTNDPHPWRCPGAQRKVRFPSRAEAKRIIRNRHVGDHTIAVYGPCETCGGGWHIGHPRLAQRDAVLAVLRKNGGVVARDVLRDRTVYGTSAYVRRKSAVRLRKILASLEKDGVIRRTETTVELVTGGGEDE